MGLFDQVVGAVSEAVSSGQASKLGHAALDLIGSQQVGGVQGLKTLFEQKGLGPVVASWIGTGPNQAITVEQLQRVLGPERIAVLAQKVGMSPEQAQQALAQLLPKLVDGVTPDGQIPHGQALAQAGLAAIKSILG